MLQSIVAMPKAKYMAVTDAFKEAIWLHGLVGDLGISQKDIVVLCDSHNAIYLAENQVYHARTEHIDVRYHFVKDIIDDEIVFLWKINTKDNLVDMLTKVVTSIKFKHCLNLVNILQVP